MVSPKSERLESFHEFKNSFHYGSRSSLGFKWLERLPDDEAADFFSEMLSLLGDLLDDGDIEPLLRRVYEWNVRGFSSELDPERFVWSSKHAPFTPLAMPLSSARVALLTSSGHFVEGHDPEPFGVKNMTQAEATRRSVEFTRIPPVLCEIPADTPVDRLIARHPGYDTGAATLDPNCVFPLQRMRELAADGTIGELADPSYSFVGSTSQTHLCRESIPAWVSKLKENGVDAVLLVPV